jgi:glutamate-1-semialdehyde 2,1-aminomutase
MEKVAPAGPIYQAGTLSGNPLAMAAGIATLDILRRPGSWERLTAIGDRLEKGVAEVIRRSGRPLTPTRVGTMSCLFFTAGPVRSWEDARKSDTTAFGRYFNRMLEAGVYLAPSQFEAGFISLAHAEADIDRTLEAMERALAD